ncbi:restriction endonuclease [Luteibacter yeojuensis]|uniref:restriction endonuclease n=1 Tax=Luteibacter yeojuensis TaxID=345309 RepID=UPI0009FF96CF
MLIPNSDIKHWHDLQDQVASLFREMGYTARTPHKLALVRGIKEVDVFVENPGHNIPHKIIAECKHWSRPVHQEVVHALRCIDRALQSSRLHRYSVILMIRHDGNS